MARRTRTKTRYRTVKKYVRRAGKGSLKGATKPILAGLVTGAVQSVIPDDMLGGYADSLAPLGVGYIMNDKTLMTIGGYQIGLKLASGFTGAQTGTNQGIFE